MSGPLTPEREQEIRKRAEWTRVGTFSVEDGRAILELGDALDAARAEIARLKAVQRGTALESDERGAQMNAARAEADSLRAALKEIRMCSDDERVLRVAREALAGRETPFELPEMETRRDPWA